MKTALLQCNPVTGDVAGNIERISDAVRAAGRVDLCVTPELALSGVAPGDFLSMNDFAEGCRRGLDILADRFRNGPDIIVGAPVPSVYEPALLSNAAVHVRGGGWEIVSRKLRPAASRDPDAKFYDRGVSCGILDVHGWRLGLVLCESDSSESFWNVSGTGYVPLLDLVSRGVDAIVHMKASPYVIGRRPEVEAMLSHAAARHRVHLLSVNLVGGSGGLIFGGQSVAIDPAGAVYARGKAFREDVLVVDMAAGTAPLAEVGRVWQENVFNALVLGTRDFVRKCGLSKAMVNLSGGIDSALVLAIAVEALGAENVSALLMPSPLTAEESVRGASQVAARLGVRACVLPLDPVQEAYTAALAPAMREFGIEGDGRPAGLQARIRGSLLGSLATMGGAMLLNAGNKSESAMGRSTLYGDTVGSLGVIADLTKTQVLAVAEWLNRAKGGDLFPPSTFRRPPDVGQTRRRRGPALPYEELDPLLDALLAAAPRTPLPESPHRDEVRDRLFRMEFKRRQEPQALYVSERPFGRAWSVPLAGNFRLP